MCIEIIHEAFSFLERGYQRLHMEKYEPTRGFYQLSRPLATLIAMVCLQDISILVQAGRACLIWNSMGIILFFFHQQQLFDLS